jgi:hypothetical protein
MTLKVAPAGKREMGQTRVRDAHHFACEPGGREVVIVGRRVLATDYNELC